VLPLGRFVATAGLRAVRSLQPVGGHWALAVGLALVLTLSLAKALRLDRSGRMAERQAAEWLAARPHLTGAVAAESARVAYYAGEHLVPVTRGSQEDMLTSLQARNARFVIVDEARLGEYTGLRAGLGDQLRLIHLAEAEGERVVVLEVTVPAPGPSM
jgi:hypothetical protein